MEEKKKVNPGIKNLKPFPNSEVAREMGRKGAIKSAEVRREKKKMKDALKSLLKLPIKNGSLKDELKELGFEDEEMNNQLALLVAAYNRGLLGDIKAIEFIRDTIGEKPKEEIELKEVPKILDDIPKKDGRS